jgi:hypothetical protein
MSAHDDDGLSHEEHEEAGEQGEDEYRDAERSDFACEVELVLVHFVDEHIYERIVWNNSRLNGFAEVLLKHVEDERGYLRREDGEVVGKNDKENAKEKPVAVLPEIFIQRTEMFHEAKVRKSET